MQQQRWQQQHHQHQGQQWTLLKQAQLVMPGRPPPACQQQQQQVAAAGTPFLQAQQLLAQAQSLVGRSWSATLGQLQGVAELACGLQQENQQLRQQLEQQVRAGAGLCISCGLHDMHAPSRTACLLRNDTQAAVCTA
jgi:hypothetical protein